MAKKTKNQSTQKIVKFVESSNVSPPYEIASIKSNTDDTTSKNKRERIDSHLCKCNNKTKSSEVWNGRGKDPEIFFQPKIRNKEKHKLKQLPQQNNGGKHDTNKTKSQHPKKHKSVKKSVINFYRKRNNINMKHVLRSKDSKLEKNKQENDYNVDDIRVESPVIRFKINRKPVYKTFHHHDGTGDSCVGGPCTKDLQNSYKQQRQNGGTIHSADKSSNGLVGSYKHENLRKVSNKRQISDKKVEKNNQISKSSSEKLKNLLSKCSVFKHFCKNSNKPQSIMDNSKGEPAFTMKVDSVDMRVLNTSEIIDKVKTFGKIEQNRSCICPSRMKSLKKRRHNVCAKGICENALSNHRKQFNCKCKVKNNLIVCKDTNCDLKTYSKNNKKSKKWKLLKQPKYKEDQGKPALEVVLDRTNMNILNSYEIENVFKKASNYEICPTGICNVSTKDPDIELKCKCVSKKILPMTTECTDKTCARTTKKCKLCDICSGLFYKSEHMFDFDKKMMRGHRKRSVVNKKYNKERQNMKAMSATNNKKVSDNTARQIKRQEEGRCETFCECGIKGTKAIKEKSKKEKGKRSKKSKEKQKRNQLRKTQKPSKTVKQNQNNNLKQYIIKCLKRKRVRCEKKLKENETEFKKNEKKAEKENLKIQKIQEKRKKIEEPHWNCLTKLISGVLNIGINLVKEIFTVAFSLLTNPIGSYVYIRERAKDPPGTIKKISGWLRRTWSNKTTKLSQTIQESDTVNVIADQIEDLAIYDALFANKGRTKAEKSLYERKKRIRKRRMKKRHDEALYGCRHMLLTTMRKTPCLWFYHICPDLYPQCLSLVSFMKNFFHIIIYLLAFICWTPCIVSFELCRAFLCCFLCTG